MAKLACPHCSYPMALAKVFSIPDEQPMGLFFCRPCDVAEVEPVALDPEATLVPGRSP